jgi:hypothetical protein
MSTAEFKPPTELRRRIIDLYKTEYEGLWGEDGRFHRDEVVGASSTLRLYDGVFERAVNSYERVTNEEEILGKIREADLVYAGDFHPLRRVKFKFQELIERGRNRREPIILLEEFSAQDQEHIDAYMQDGDLDKLKTHWHHEGTSSWRGIKKILEYARNQEIPTYGIDAERLATTDYGSTAAADYVFGSRIVDSLNTLSQVWVYVGELHLAPGHTPGVVRRARQTTAATLAETVHGQTEGSFAEIRAVATGELKEVTLFQGLEEVFWQLLEQGIAHTTKAVRIADNIYCLNNVPALLRAMVYDVLHDYQGELDDPEEPHPAPRVTSEQLRKEYQTKLSCILAEALEIEDYNEYADIDELERLIYDAHDDEVLRKEGKLLLAK